MKQDEPRELTLQLFHDKAGLSTYIRTLYSEGVMASIKSQGREERNSVAKSSPTV